jgi:hypothetical protein
MTLRPSSTCAGKMMGYVHSESGSGPTNGR